MVLITETVLYSEGVCVVGPVGGGGGGGVGWSKVQVPFAFIIVMFHKKLNGWRQPVGFQRSPTIP